MAGRSSASRSRSFIIFVLGVLVFTIIATTYEPRDPLFHKPSETTQFLDPNPTFQPENTVINTDLSSEQEDETPKPDCESNVGDPIDCRDPEVFHVMMKKAIKHFKDIHFYRFGKPVRGSNDSTCDMAWRFRPKEGKTNAFNKDYRRFVVYRSRSCTYSVDSMGEYHSGVNARKPKKHLKPGGKQEQGSVLPVVELESEMPVIRGKYLIYTGGGDRCKSMNHYLWSLLCALGEAQYLNRTLVMDLSICLSSMYTSSNQAEEGKDFRFYFDFEHLNNSASVLDQGRFWSQWTKSQDKDRFLSIKVVEDFRVTPMKLAQAKDVLVMRKFGSVEPDNYWYKVCEGEAESAIHRPWHVISKSSRLMDIASTISSKMNLDYDAVHIVRGEKAMNKDLWPNLARDTSPDSLISSLLNKVQDGRNLYIATNEPDPSFFDPLKDKYSTHFLDEYKELWDESSEWYSETTKLNNGVPVEFDGYMRVSVDTQVFLRGKKQIDTFNDLTSDCKDGVNTCNIAAS